MQLKGINVRLQLKKSNQVLIAIRTGKLNTRPTRDVNLPFTFKFYYHQPTTNWPHNLTVFQRHVTALSLRYATNVKYSYRSAESMPEPSILLSIQHR